MDEWCVVDGPTAAEDSVEPPAAEAPPDRLGDCRVGDQVSAPRAFGLYRHHAVLLTGGRVLHVNGGPHAGWAVCLGWSPAMLRVDTVERFLRGAPRLHCVARSGDGGATAERRARLEADAPTDYNLLWNNCEHAASCNAGLACRSVQSRRAALVAAAAAVAVAVGLAPAAALVAAGSVVLAC